MNRRGAQLTGPLGGSGVVGLWGASSLIKSIQTVGVSVGASAATATATITAVNPNHTILLRESWYGNFGVGNSPGASLSDLTLTNATTVTATVYTTGTGTDSFQRGYVVEFMPGVLKSAQYGNITIASSAASATATITAVNTAKALLLFCGHTSTASGAYSATDIKDLSAYMDLTNSTTVTALRPGTGANALGSRFCIAEMF